MSNFGLRGRVPVADSGEREVPMEVRAMYAIRAAARRAELAEARLAEALEALRGLLRGDEPCVLARRPDEPYACSRGTKGCNKQHPPDVRETAFGVLSRAEGELE